MRFLAKVVLVITAVSALVLAWGYWYASSHVALQLRVDDYALRSPIQAYGVPHRVTLTLRDGSNTQLAVARSVEPLGYLLAVHPNPEIGTCQPRALGTSSGPETQADYRACYERYSAWSATWAPRVRSADVKVGACEIRGVPVSVHSSNKDWLLWWVPLPDVGGLPQQYFEFVVAVDSRACAPVDGEVIKP